MRVRLLHPYPLGDAFQADMAEGAEVDLPAQVAQALIDNADAEHAN
jgi:hypothetical protein